MEKIQKRGRQPQGYYKILENAAIARDRKICGRNPDVLGIYQAERVVAKKIHNGKALFMVHWHGYCPSKNTWEPKVHLPPELLEAFRNPDPDLVRVEEARERIGLTFERGMKVLFNSKSRSKFAMMWSVSCSRTYQRSSSRNPQRSTIAK